MKTGWPLEKAVSKLKDVLCSLKCEYLLLFNAFPIKCNQRSKQPEGKNISFKEISEINSLRLMCSALLKSHKWRTKHSLSSFSQHPYAFWFHQLLLHTCTSVTKHIKGTARCLTAFNDPMRIPKILQTCVLVSPPSPSYFHPKVYAAQHLE